MRMDRVSFYSAALMVLSLSSTAMAQLTQYGEFQRAISDARSNAAYIESIESAARTPNAKYSPLVLDKVAVEEMVTTWKKNLNRGVPLAPRSSAELAVIAQQQKINDVENAARQGVFLKRIDTEMPFYRQFTSDGFSGQDAQRLADLIVFRDSTVSKNAGNIMGMAGFYPEFKRKLDTALFPDLLSMLLQYEITPYAAIDSLERLEKRFPDQQYVIDMTYLKVIPWFYRSVKYEGNTAFPIAELVPSTPEARMNARLLQLVRKYPEAGMRTLHAMSLVEDRNKIDPIDSEYIRLYGIKKGNDAKKLMSEIAELQKRYP